MTLEDLKKILLTDKPSILIKENENEMFNFIKELKVCKGFDQKNKEWHPYDVYNHILNVVNNVETNYELRLSALFHDIGKPPAFVLDENGIGHFPNHWIESQKIFELFASRNNIDNKTKELVSKLILFHDINMNKLESEKVQNVINNLSLEEMILLFKLKRADLLAQNKEKYYMLDDYDKQEEKILKLYKKEKENI